MERTRQKEKGSINARWLRNKESKYNRNKRAALTTKPREAINASRREHRQLNDPPRLVSSAKITKNCLLLSLHSALFAWNIFQLLKLTMTVSVCAVEQTPKLQSCTLQETLWIQTKSWTGHCKTKNYVSVIYRIDSPWVHKYFAFPLSYELLNT